jgi:hypothetical protein
MARTLEICAGDDFRIAADGTWFHDGRPIRRPAMVRLFASILHRDGDGAYWLVTPAEKVRVAVDDAPFVAVGMDIAGTASDQVVTFETNIGTRVRLDAAHPLRVRVTAAGPRPYLALDGGLEALVARSVYYELAALAAPGADGRGAIVSAGAVFALEPEATAP